MTDLSYNIILSVTTLASIAIVSVAGLKGWREWIGLRREEMQAGNSALDRRTMPNVMDRIDIADMKERLRKLEAIAAGVEL